MLCLGLILVVLVGVQPKQRVLPLHHQVLLDGGHVPLAGGGGLLLLDLVELDEGTFDLLNMTKDILDLFRGGDVTGTHAEERQAFAVVVRAFFGRKFVLCSFQQAIMTVELWRLTVLPLLLNLEW